MTFRQKIKLDTPAKVVQWTMIISLLALIMPEAVATLPMTVGPATKEWLGWISKIIIAVANFYNLTSGKKPE